MLVTESGICRSMTKGTDVEMNGEKGYKGGARTNVGRTQGTVRTFFDRTGTHLSGLYTRAAAAARRGSADFLHCLAAGGTAFLLGRAGLFFGIYPLGIAFLAAAPARIPYIAAGLIISAVTLMEGAPGGALAVACVGTLGLRLLSRIFIDPPADGRSLSASLFGESVYLRMASSATVAFGVGVYRMIYGGFYFYDLWGAIASMVICPLAVYLYAPLFDTGEETQSGQTDAQSLRRDAAGIALAVSLCLGLRTDSVFGIGMGQAAVCAVTLFAVQKRGYLRGALTGLCCGAVTGWVYAPLYALSALAAGALMKISVLAGATAVVLIGALASAFTGGVTSFLTLFPSQLCGIVVFCSSSLVFERLKAVSPGAVAEEASAAAAGDNAGKALSDCRGRMDELSEAFGSLAASFREMSETRRRPSMSELRAACDAACDKHCPGCQNRQLCWDLEYASTLDMLGKICSSVYRNGRASPDDLPEYMRRRCRALPQIAALVNENTVSLVRAAMKDERLSLFASDYRAVSAVLSKAVAANRGEHEPDPERRERVRAILSDAAVGFCNISVSGKRRVDISVYGADLYNTRIGAADLRRRIEAALGVPLTTPAFVPGRDGAVLSFTSRRLLTVTFAAARSAPDGDFAACGDTVCRIDGRDDRFYALVCDGMGTGGDAAFASGICGLFLKRMLGAGMGVDSALSMLNAVLRADTGECSVGLDLLAVDLLDGTASIYKSGAAPTYLCRDGRIYPLRSPSAPMGILRELEAVRSDFKLRGGDLLFMCSDGVMPERPEEEPGDGPAWLFDLLRNGRNDEINEAQAEDIARRAVRSARAAGSRDDVSAAVIAIHPCLPPV